MAIIERAFIRIAEGQVHLRQTVGSDSDGRLPLVLLHPSPGSSIGLVPLMEALVACGAPRLIALDTLGNGDSAAPVPDAPDIAYFADAALRALTAMGVERFHLYGALTGARMACEMAVVAPERIDRLVLEGMGEFSPEWQALLLDRYAPEMAPHDYGYQLLWAFNFVRDQALHFPYFQRDPDHRLMTRAVPDADELHMRAVEVLKALRTYHKSYRAAFPYASKARLAHVTAPAYFLAAAGDGKAIADQQIYADCAQDGRVTQSGMTPTDKAATIAALIG
ncbi:alpha/beta hydrolase [Sphingobium sp. Leaf26]|uniref:alpha/beta hydrolase n=1 Tax=Sphingobium sp. Leaf26 TaxID=1735693 RepID=UPI00138F5F46|nr:alpha/beta hydrolase [Sphingobium sp. Leaf26]